MLVGTSNPTCRSERMLRKIVTVLVLVPLAILIVMFAVANRETVTVVVRSVRCPTSRRSRSKHAAVPR